MLRASIIAAANALGHSSRPAPACTYRFAGGCLRLILAGESKYRHVVAEHSRILGNFGKTYGDALIEDLLANDVEPRPFEAGGRKK